MLLKFGKSCPRFVTLKNILDSSGAIFHKNKIFNERLKVAQFFLYALMHFARCYFIIASVCDVYRISHLYRI